MAVKIAGNRGFAGGGSQCKIRNIFVEAHGVKVYNVR